MGGISIWQLLIILVIVVLLFGTKKLRNMGGDLGSALKSFKKAIGEDDKKNVNDDTDNHQESRIIDGESDVVDKKKAD